MKQLKNHYKALILFISIFIIIGCSDPIIEPVNLPGQIYVAGSYTTGGYEYGAYWVANRSEHMTE